MALDKIKLPSLKLTQRSTHGPTRHRTVPRGVTTDSFVVKSNCDSISDPVVPDHNDCGEPGEMLSGDNGLKHSGNNDPSLHYIHQAKGCCYSLGTDSCCNSALSVMLCPITRIALCVRMLAMCIVGIFLFRLLCTCSLYSEYFSRW